MDYIISFFDSYSEYGNFISYILVFSLLLISGFGVPIPEDITLVTAGILASQGYAHHYSIFAVCMLGVLIGDSTMYFLGYIFGVKILRNRLLRKILTPRRLKTIRYRFQENSFIFLFIARFLPGLRAAIYLFSGITRKVSYWKFIGIDLLASILSVPVWVGLGYYFGDNIHHLKIIVHKLGLGVSITAIIVIILVIFIIKKRIKKVAISKSNQKESSTNIDNASKL